MTDDRPLAVVLVAAVDRRVLPAVSLLPQLIGSDARALHIATDPEQSYRLARDWMDLGIGSLPLHVEEPMGDTLAGSVRRVIEREVRSRPRITVIVPEMDLGRWWQPLLHRGTGRAVAWELAGLQRVTTVVVPVRVDLPARTTTMGG
ncbi:MAG: hypothetical protein QOG87_3202 [Actinomycetota bacterium]|jgi:hypothetical protein